jgi:arsenate reductase
MRSEVLFVCVRNSSRSQMAEAFLNDLCPDDFIAESAGLEPGTLDPLAVALMQEVGIDISACESKSVFDIFKAGKTYAHVITVCDEASSERCPVFPGRARRRHWSLKDPVSLKGSWEERLSQARPIRDEIRSRILAWCKEMRSSKSDDCS